MDNRLSPYHVVIGVRSALEQLTVQGARNANLLAACCNDLDKLITYYDTKNAEAKTNGNNN